MEEHVVNVERYRRVELPISKTHLLATELACIRDPNEPLSSTVAASVTESRNAGSTSSRSTSPGWVGARFTSPAMSSLVAMVVSPVRCSVILFQVHPPRITVNPFEGNAPRTVHVEAVSNRRRLKW